MYRTVFLSCALALAFPVFASGADWQVPGDFATIQEAIDSSDVAPGDKILVGAGEHFGALVSKAVEIKGNGGAIINDGPLHPAGLTQGFRLVEGSDGATISHLTFTTDLSIMNGAGSDDVTVTQCTFHDSIQAVSNWRGSRWEITHNRIIDLRTRNGGGIGILIADFDNGAVQDNVVSHNEISGTLHVAAGDGGGYAGTGVVLYADYRWGRLGTNDMSFNRVVKNKISLTSDDRYTVDVYGIELTVAGSDDPAHADNIHDNSVSFNDLRGMYAEDKQLALTPAALDEINVLSRNLGENRGHGAHPALFHPEGG